MLERVGIPNPELRMKQYPHEFSGGMRQRVMIAIAMTLNPDLLIADEPTTALDVTVQADILDMMKEIQKEHPMSIILITHDLGIVANLLQILLLCMQEKSWSVARQKIFSIVRPILIQRHCCVQFRVWIWKARNWRQSKAHRRT